MIAGKLKYKLTIFEPIVTIDAMGAEVVTYEMTRVVHAERVRTSGNRSEEVGEHFADYNAEFNIRSAHHIGENWRVQQVGGYLYTVIAIIPNLDRGYNTLICSRVND